MTNLTLNEIINRIQVLIAKSPKRSYTADRAKDLIATLTSAECSLDESEKVTRALACLRTYKRGIQVHDPVHKTPDVYRGRGG